MARRKNAPESIRVKHGLSDRLRSLRNEFYGERGGPDLARTLGIPVRTWYNYENGVTVPAEIILRIVELTSVEPVWLLRGEGAKFRTSAASPAPGVGTGSADGLASSPITTLLRVALERLEEEQRTSLEQHFGPPIVTRRDGEAGPGIPKAEGDDELSFAEAGQAEVVAEAIAPDAVRGDWIETNRPSHNLRVTDDSMAPIVADGAHVTYAEAEPASEAFHDKLVVAWVDGTAVVRWFQFCGRFALLRAENPQASPPSLLVDLDQAEGSSTFHKVLWISTPH